jgi:hypothetical protein
MTAKTLSSLVGGGLSAIQAVDIKNKTSAALVTQVSNSAVNATGVGVTYTVTGRCVLLFAALTGLTTSDTIYTLTCDGGIKSQVSTPVAGTSIPIINVAFSVSATASASEVNLGAGILCESGFTLFVKTTSSTSINVAFNYLELN